MSYSGNDPAKKKSSGKPKTPQEIFTGFQTLRTEQKIISQKISELEIEQQEHKLVISTLKKMQSGRKCFRMIGGVLCERTVGEVLPVLMAHEERLGKVLEALNQQLVAKGVELNAYKEQYNVKIKGVDDVNEATVEPESKPAAGGGVLVS